MNIEELIENVRAWGIARNITGPNGKGTLLAQLSKTQEELTEARDAAVRIMESYGLSDGAWNADQRWRDSADELKDGIGDCTVTLILAAEMAGLRFEDCLAAAYDEIKGRTGKMEGGQFVKDKP
jgi:NTP pyrophosphatase (non-canonical NTP hydrolase)